MMLITVDHIVSKYVTIFMIIFFGDNKLGLSNTLIMISSWTSGSEAFMFFIVVVVVAAAVDRNGTSMSFIYL